MASQGVGLQLYKPLAVGDDLFVTEVSARAFDTYRRVTLRDGGDHEAEFVIANVKKNTLENNFIDWIGYHFVEKIGALTTFEGYVHEMQLRIGGKLLRITMDGFANSAQTRYKSELSGSYTLSSAVTSADSIALFGTSEYIRDSRLPTNSTAATALAQSYLDDNAFPNAYGTDLADSYNSDPALFVRIKGYIHTLDRRYYSVAAETADDSIEDQIGTVLTGVDFITEGDTTDAPSTSVPQETDSITKLRWMGERLGNTGQAWGCFAGRTFTVSDVDVDEPTFYRRMRKGSREVRFASGHVIKPQTIRPYGLMWTSDIFGGPAPTTNKRFDPRADIISGVEFTKRGIQFIPANRPGAASQANAAKYAEVYIANGGPRLIGPPGNIKDKPRPGLIGPPTTVTRK